MVALRAPTASGSVGISGREIKIEDGMVDVPGDIAATLKASHGFVDPGEPARPAAAGPGDGGDRVELPRALVISALKDLGVVVADRMPPDLLGRALAEAAAKQRMRLDFELQAADRRNAEKLDQAVAAAEQRGEQRALERLTADVGGEKLGEKAGEQPPAAAPATGADKTA